jgi:hypothetical protein
MHTRRLSIEQASTPTGNAPIQLDSKLCRRAVTQAQGPTALPEGMWLARRNSSEAPSFPVATKLPRTFSRALTRTVYNTLAAWHAAANNSNARNITMTKPKFDC